MTTAAIAATAGPRWRGDRTVLLTGRNDATSSSAICGRRFGSFSRQRITSAASAGGTSRTRCRERRRQLGDVRRDELAAAVRPANGCAPASSS